MFVVTSKNKSDQDLDIADLLGELVVEDFSKDKFLRNDVTGESNVKTLSIQEERYDGSNEDSDLLSAEELENISDYPASKDVPAITAPRVASSPKRRRGPYKTRSIKPKAEYTQRQAYELFQGCLEWFKKDDGNLFQNSYWVEMGIPERIVEKLRNKYPICQFIGEHIKSAQEARLIKGAVTGKLHAGFVKFYLNCQYQDKYIPRTESKTEVTGDIRTAPVQITFEEVTNNNTVLIQDQNGQNKSIAQATEIPLLS